MAFQLKDFVSIVASELNHARAVTQKVTDYAPGSIVRTLLEAPAVEIEQLYMQYFIGLKEAIPVSTFLSFGFDTLPAALARGFVTVSNATAPNYDILIPVGTAFTTTSGLVYYSSSNVTWVTGANSVSIPVQAAAVGAAYNMPAGAINSSSFFGVGFVISNSAITTGRDVETDQERAVRFSDYVAALSAGTTEACKYAVGRANVLDSDGNISEYVTRVAYIETPGYVQYFIYGSGGIASNDIISAAQVLLDGTRDPTTGAIITPGYRAAGVNVVAQKMVERAVASSFNVTMQSGYSLDDTVNAALISAYNSAIIAVSSGTTLYMGTLVEKLLDVTGVQTVVPLSDSNIVCGANEALIPGSLVINP
jgi:Baseplate J-like protein